MDLSKSGWYPETTDKEFYNKLYSRLEFSENLDIPGIYSENYQQFVKKFINRQTPYKSLLLFWELGTGKTKGSIDILEGFKPLVGQDNGLEKFLIITKNKTLQSTYKKELLADPTNTYASSREKEAIRKNDKETIKIVKSRISNYYEFINYDEFVNKVIGRTHTSEITGSKRREVKGDNVDYSLFDNRIIVIDEVQNITGNFRYLSLMRVLKNSINTRLILLSGTPIVDSPTEIIYISNLLNFSNPYFVLDDNSLELNKSADIQLEKLINKFKSPGLVENIVVNNNNILTFTSKGQELLAKSLQGKVSYVKGNRKNYPKTIRVGESLRNATGSLTVYRCPMSDYQSKVYIESLKEKTTFYTLPSNIATMTYKVKDNEVIQESMDKKNLKGTPLNYSSIGLYSSKFKAILSNINSSPGISFIYSNNVQTSGTILAASVLDANGYYPYGSKHKGPSKGAYILYGEQLSDSKRSQYEKIINSKENIRGDIIKIIIGSPVISEGVSFFNVRQVHILEPFWNLAKTLQAEGRCVRNYSHISLPPDERNVSIYWYVSTSKDIITIDETKYLVCEEKDRINKSIERLMKEISIDCYRMEKKSDTNLNNSRECDYTLCDYTCKYINNDKISKEKIDISYNNFTAPDQIRYSKEMIKTYFNTSREFPIDKILSYPPLTQVNKSNVYYAIDDLVSNKQKFLSKVWGYGYVAHSGKYYRFISTPMENKNINPKTIDSYLNSKSSSIATSSKTKPVTIDSESDNESDDVSPVISKLYQIEDFANNQNINYIGLVEDNIFKIVDLSKNKSKGTARDQSRGKNCLSFSKGELFNIAKYFNANIHPQSSKLELCSLVKNTLEMKKLILEI